MTKRAAFNEAWKLSYNLAEAAAYLETDKATVTALIEGGHLEGLLMDRAYFVRADVLRGFKMPRPEVVAVAVAEPAPVCGVYLLMIGEVVVYVGRSTTIRSRLAAHQRSSRPYDEARVIECAAEASVWLEKELIRTLRPAQNIVRYQRQARASEKSLRRLSGR